MKIIENLIKILFVLLLLFLLIQNSDQRINLQLFTLYYPNVNLAIVLLITLGIGAVLGAVMLSFNILSLRSEIRNVQKKNKQLIRELENLRNISIEEIPDGDVQDATEKKENS